MWMRRAMVVLVGLMLSGLAGACDSGPDPAPAETDAEAPEPSGEETILPTVERGGEGSPERSWLGPGAEHREAPPERVVESPKLSVGAADSVKRAAAAKSAGSGEAAGIGDLGAVGRGGGGGGEEMGHFVGLGKAKGAGSGGGGKTVARGGARTGTKLPNRQQAGQLTAARWSDIEHWEFWRGLFEGEQGEPSDRVKHEEEWEIFTRRRVPVRVVAAGEPVADVPVRLRSGTGEVLWRSRTDNGGRAELFPSLYLRHSSEGTYDLIVGAGQEEEVLEGVEPRARRYEVDLPAVEPPEPSLDLMLTVDTTGSMGDELSYLEAELGEVVERVEERLDRDISLRTSANFYRDTGDTYVVHSNPFTTSVDRVVGQIGAERAGGGGDFPEAVDRALVDSVDNHEWRRRATARLMFLVLDAPPHGGEAQRRRVRQAVRRAARRGIRVIPVVGSGIDKSTEFLMRFAAIATGGTYVFLTDDSGIGGDHIEPTIGPHDVKKLNDLLVEVIVSYVE